MQITLLKFEDNWILYSEVLEFGFYPLKFGDIWILYHNISESIFYSLYFKSVVFYSLMLCLEVLRERGVEGRRVVERRVEGNNYSPHCLDIFKIKGDENN